MPTKDDLLKTIQRAREELNSIERAENIKKNTALVGKCFRFWNSYGGDEHWWLYIKIIGLDDTGNLKAFLFHEHKRFECWIETHFFLSSAHQQISAKYFADNWKWFKRELTAFGDSRLKPKRAAKKGK